MSITYNWSWQYTCVRYIATQWQSWQKHHVLMHYRRQTKWLTVALITVSHVKEFQWQGITARAKRSRPSANKTVMSRLALYCMVELFCAVECLMELKAWTIKHSVGNMINKALNSLDHLTQVTL